MTCSALSVHSHVCGRGSFLDIKCCSWAHILSETSDWLLPKYNLNWLKIEQSHANPVALATLLTANLTSTPEGVKGNLLIVNTLWQWTETAVHQKVFSNITIAVPICNCLILPPPTTWSLENSYRTKTLNYKWVWCKLSTCQHPFPELALPSPHLHKPLGLQIKYWANNPTGYTVDPPKAEIVYIKKVSRGVPW